MPNLALVADPARSLITGKWWAPVRVQNRRDQFWALWYWS